MGTEQSENKNREGKRRIIIASAGRPVREVWTDKTFEKAPYVKRLKTHQSGERTFKNAPVDRRFENTPMTRADLYWLAYQRGWRDAMRKGRET